ncbi:hypothetical protein AVEN_2041-1 [Araneus ventricosus]|uniref:Uncharacterized protein n=1 Tax=Araneus ventricosus TaxID=182803 RepID=A0A4Y2F4L9_ARAVE|nr:hypothetical protein AVEN_2041-1 [Araneus ventricosus]
MKKEISLIAILVCSRLAVQICKLAASLTRQECKCETGLQQVNGSFEVTMGRTCSKLALQIIEKAEFEHNPGENSRSTRSEADALTIRPVKFCEEKIDLANISFDSIRIDLF